MSELMQRPALIRKIDREKKRVRALVSTGSIDRYNEIILPSAFAKSIKTYMANPVLLWGHKSYGGPEVAIGQAVHAHLVEEGLEAEFEYSTEVNPTAKMVWDLVQAGVIRAFSIGAIANAWIDKWTEKPDLSQLPDYARDAFIVGQARRVYTQVEWVETSQVLVPANRDALIAAMLSETVDRDFALRTLGELELVRSNRTGNWSWPGWDPPTPQKEAAKVDNLQKAGLGPEELKKAVGDALDGAIKTGLTETVRGIVQEEIQKAQAAAAEEDQIKRDLEALIESDPGSLLAALETMQPAE